MKKLCLLLTAVVMLWLPACAVPQNGLVNQGQILQYKNEELAFSIAYPGNWQLVELSLNEILISPPDSEYNQVRVRVQSDFPELYYISETGVASTIETTLQQFFDLIGASNLDIVLNERLQGDWDWIAQFTVNYGGKTLDGFQFMKQADSVTYWVFIMKYANWPEGSEVIDSFKPLK
ncbi:hypothetical protein ACFLV3_03040 [Chloroflexota bacterium]